MPGIKGLLLLFMLLGAMYLGAQAEDDIRFYGEFRGMCMGGDTELR